MTSTCVLCGATGKVSHANETVPHEPSCPHFMRGPDPGGDPHEWPTLLDELDNLEPCSHCGGDAIAGTTCPRSVACPQCGVGPDESCRRPSGHRADQLHAGRIQYAEALDELERPARHSDACMFGRGPYPCTCGRGVPPVAIALEQLDQEGPTGVAGFRSGRYA